MTRMAIRALARWVLGALSPAGTSRVQARAAQARTTLAALLKNDLEPSVLPKEQQSPRPFLAYLPFPPDFLRACARHSWLVILVFCVAGSEQLGHLSAQVFNPPAPRPVLATVAVADTSNLGQEVFPAELASEQIFVSAPSTAAEPLMPALSAPLEVVDAFSTVHQLAEDESLGGIAEQYGVSVESLVWANGLERGDALVLGQSLRIPRISGITYQVRDGDSVQSIAERFMVPAEAILTFGPNRLAADQALWAGQEIFIPGGSQPLPDALLGAGIEGLAQRGAEPAGIVLSTQTNLREGPSTEYERAIQLDTGRQVALRGRYGDWLKVEIAGVQGWVRTDLLQIAEGVVDTLPETNDFPPPPPRWVWPARGTITSGFGARWGSFHDGLDIANRAWTPIMAARTGTVSEAGWCRGFGYCVKIRHDGGVQTVYGHLIAQPPVSAGDTVMAGEVIGYMGSTYDRAGGGYSTGVHLHFMIVVNGTAVNPRNFLP